MSYGLQAVPRPALTPGVEGLRRLQGGRRTDAVMSELAGQACEMPGVDASMVVVHDSLRPGSGIAAAAQGMPAGTLGSSFEMSKDPIGSALNNGRPLVED